jgi:cbb3-type cytochrome oxidase subunit 3
MSLLAGLLLGTSFGVFIFGLVFGGGAVFLFRKYKKKDDEITMEILPNESD